MMNTLKNNRGNKGQHIRSAALSIFMVLVLFFGMVAIPFESHAASKKKTVLSVSNLSSNTVVQRGGTYRINARAYRKKGSSIKGLKVKYKSSNKKIATVSKNGVIRGKKNGKVKITVRCKGKKKTYKIRVGTQVNTISISGYHYLRKGRTNTLKAHVNGNATNKTVHWRSTNTNVATITDSGKLTATGYGTATIVAYAVDGSGTAATVTVAVPKYSGYPSGGIKWIAHRGLHTSATENTTAAFIAAGQAGGFWGCECDIWETKHETSQVSGAETENEERVSEMRISENTEDSGEVTTGDEEKSAEEDSELQEEPQAGVQAESIKAKETVDTFDLVINHDDTFSRTMELNRSVRDMTATEIKNQLSGRGVCFFGKYLDICKQYGMVPVVEFKDPWMSDAAVKMAVDELDKRDLLEEACLISFYTDVLIRVKEYSNQKLGHDPYTAYLISSADLGAVDHAKTKGYTCISVTKSSLTPTLYNKCRANGLKVGTWTYRENANNDHLLYLHTMTGQYSLDFATVDYKPY